MGGTAGRKEDRRACHVSFEVLPGVYPPAEDTWLLVDYVDSLGKRGLLRGRKFLEVGCGTGVASVVAALHGADVVAVDINPEAVENTILNAQKNGVRVNAFVSDLFEHVNGKYDVIVFNPPYLPGGEEDPAADPAWSGGEGGRGVILRFLRNVGAYLSDRGILGLVASSLNEVDKIIAFAENIGVSLRIWRELPLFFERLYLLEGKACR